LSAQVVNFGGLHIFQDAPECGAIRQIAIVQKEPCFLVMRVFIDVINAIGVKGRGSPDNTVNFIIFL